MKSFLILSLLFVCVGFVAAEQPSAVVSGEKDTLLVLQVYLGEVSDSNIAELKSKIFRQADDFQKTGDKFRTEYAEEIRKNGGFNLDFERVRKLAEGGNAFAQVRLGIAYMHDQNDENGLYGLPMDVQQATVWLTKAAQNENPRAQWILAMKSDAALDDSIRWFLRVARHASPNAYQMASMEIRTKQNLKNANAAQVQAIFDFEKTLTQTEKLAAGSLVILNNLKHGKSPFGDRELTASEVAIARKHFNF